MTTFLVQEVYQVEAENAEDALAAAKAASPNSDATFVVADRLGGLLNPVHHADSQAAFGHIEPPAPATEETEAEAPVTE